jgi:hypothetical protein
MDDVQQILPFRASGKADHAVLGDVVVAVQFSIPVCGMVEAGTYGSVVGGG